DAEPRSRGARTPRSGAPNRPSGPTGPAAWPRTRSPANHEGSSTLPRPAPRLRIRARRGPRSRSSRTGRPGRARSSIAPSRRRPSAEADVEVLVQPLAPRLLHLHFAPRLFAEERARERARDADAPLVDVRFVGPDDAVGDLFVGLRVGELH